MTAIALQNGAKLLAVDLRAHTREGSGTDVGFSGYALAQTQHGEYVTWRVSATTNPKLDAYDGNYHRGDYSAAVTDYDRRRVGTMVPAALVERASLA